MRSSRAVSEMVRLCTLMSRNFDLCSRREADKFIADGLVTVNGVKVSKLGTKFDASRPLNIKLLEPALRELSQKATVILHKPLDIVSVQPEKGHQPAVQLLTNDRKFESPRDPPSQPSPQNGRGDPRYWSGWSVAGRLDINSTGLLVLTQSGRLVKQIIGPDTRVEKEYLVRFHNPPLGRDLRQKVEKLKEGVRDDETNDWLFAKAVNILNSEQIRFVLTSGKRRHIRRMCAIVGLKPMHLKRVRIGGVVLGDLPLGQWRFLRPDESFLGKNQAGGYKKSGRR